MRKTSLDAYREIKSKGLLPKARMVVLDSLIEMGRPATANELVWIKGVHGAWKRLSELRRMGVVRESGTAKCPITGKSAIVWEPTGSLPLRLSKGVSEKARMERYLRFADEGLRLASEKIRKECQKDEPTTKLLAVIEYTRGKIREGRAVPTRAKDT